MSLWLWAGGPPAILLGLAVCADLSPSPLLVNETKSVPAGLYLRQLGEQPQLGSIVAVHQPSAAREVLADLGVDPDMALLKRVAALPGQAVCSDGRRVVTPLGAHAINTFSDRPGAPRPWLGCGPLGPDEFFLLGDTAWSYDSRYFGPVRADGLIGVYQAMVTW